jgi:hypothetical protein
MVTPCASAAFATENADDRDKLKSQSYNAAFVTPIAYEGDRP